MTLGCALQVNQQLEQPLSMVGMSHSDARVPDAIMLKSLSEACDIQTLMSISETEHAEMKYESFQQVGHTNCMRSTQQCSC